jgi:hypothetical protein
MWSACRFGLAIALVLLTSPAVSAAKTKPPRIVLWSWYADDDLRFLKDSEIGVAYLGLTVEFQGRQVIANPRAVPLQLSPATWRMPVVRLQFREDVPKLRPVFGDAQRERAARMIAEVVEITESRAVQIDFDAPASAQPFYRKLLADVRSRLGPDVFLSMTALASWCDSERSWLAGVAVDEIVPMTFRLGAATPGVVAALQRGGRFAFPGCGQSIGIELGGERIVVMNPVVPRIDVRPRKEQRAYFFPLMTAWSPELVRSAKETFLP